MDDFSLQVLVGLKKTFKNFIYYHLNVHYTFHTTCNKLGFEVICRFSILSWYSVDSMMHAHVIVYFDFDANNEICFVSREAYWYFVFFLSIWNNFLDN